MEEMETGNGGQQKKALKLQLGSEKELAIKRGLSSADTEVPLGPFDTPEPGNPKTRVVRVDLWEGVAKVGG